MITTEIITEIHQLDQIEYEWSELYNKSSNATPFQAPFWMINWWRNFGKNGLITLIVRNNGKLIGIAPCFVYLKEKYTKCLCLLGTGISDYLDILYLSDYIEEIKRELGNFLYSISDLWEECDFQELPITSPLLQVHEYVRAFKTKQILMSICSCIDGSSVESVRQLIPKKLRKNIQNCINAIKSKYTVFFGYDNTPENLIDLHSKRWKVKKMSGVLHDDAIQQFHYDVLNRASLDNSAMIYSLKIEEKVIACYYVLIRKSNAYFYLSGFDPDYSEYSPGTMALYLAISDLFKKGITCFDFLRGIEEYKNHWGVNYKNNYGVKIYKLNSTNE